MGDLRKNAARLQELASWVMLREGYLPYFYDDNEGYVTIGFGTLVATVEDAKRIGADPDVTFSFTKPPHKVATVAEVAEDWKRVHDKPGLREHDYSKVALLKLDTASVNHLMMQEISKSASALYKHHPFLVNFDSQVAMAFVDTRYNPAGVNPYQSPQTRPLWEAMDPKGKAYDPEKAIKLFDHIWGGRGGKNKVRYHGRHLKRLEWFRAGLDAMGPGASMSVAS